MPFHRPSRRDLLSLAATLPLASIPAGARAMLGAPAAGNPGHFSFTLGEARLTVVSDGHLELPVSMLGVNADPAAVQALLRDHHLAADTNYAHTNHLVIELGDAVVLVDCGSGDRFLPTAGRLWDRLGAAGIDAGAITHCVVTHAHPDHIWGIRDGFDEAILPGIPYFIGETERAYWLQDGLVDRVAPEDQQFVLGAVNSLQVDGADWTLLSDGQEIAPGIRALATPGHTPGHMAVAVESGGQQLLAVGDALNHAVLSFARPDWVAQVDIDPDRTVATRRRLLDMAAADDIAILGYHFPFPGVGHVRRDGDAYAFVPALWRW